MIDRIGTIYEEAYSKSSTAVMEDMKLSEEIKELLAETDDRRGLSRDEVGDLVFAGSSTGQAQGFREGFRYAFALMFESLLG